MEQDEKELGTEKKRLKKREERVEKLRLFSGGGGSKSKYLFWEVIEMGGMFYLWF